LGDVQEDDSMTADAGGGTAGIYISGKVRLRAGVSCAALALACWFPTAASAGTYFVDSEAELNSAIVAANGDGNPSSTIVMTQSFGVLGTTQLPTPTKPLTIDTNGFVLSGIGVNSANPGAIRFLGPFPDSTLTIGARSWARLRHPASRAASG
jgi:fibronectin-binding autotransporter adhesin